MLTIMEDSPTGFANHLLPYLDMLFASIDSDGYGEADGIVLFTALPPLGWTHYSDLDVVYARGASTAGGGFVNTATDTHTHSCSTTTSEHTNEPSYIEVIYAQRNDPVPSASLGDEEAVSGGVAVSTKVGAGSLDLEFLLSDHLGSTRVKTLCLLLVRTAKSVSFCLIITDNSGDMVLKVR